MQPVYPDPTPCTPTHITHSHSPISRLCEVCKEPFHPQWNQLTEGRGRFCSVICRGKHQTRDTETLFWQKVQKTEGCWIWTACTNKQGYGKFSKQGRTIVAHRYSFELHFGLLPEGLFACHSCDNPSCVNPDHLFAGTSEDNNKDCCAKGRNALGSRNGNATLTDDQARAIRERYKQGSISQRALGIEFGVAQSCVQRIVSGRGWKHIPEREITDAPDTFRAVLIQEIDRRKHEGVGTFDFLPE